MGSVVQGNNQGLYLEALFVEGTVACHSEHHRSMLVVEQQLVWCHNVVWYCATMWCAIMQITCVGFLLLLLLVCGSG